MKLVPDIRKKVRAYSIWSMVLSLVLFLLPEAFYSFTGRELASPYLVGKMALFFGVYGVLGWFIDQRVPDLWRTAKLALFSLIISAVIWLILALPTRAMDMLHPATTPPVVASGLPEWSETASYAIPLTAKWEGLRTTAYLDRIASPPVWTVCYGETFNVSPNETRTEAQCREGLREGLHRYWVIYRRDVTIPTLAPQTDAAMTDLAWNIGSGALSRSTALRRLNAGDIAGACDAITWWNKAGGRVVRGLVRRGADRHALCMEGTP